MRVGLNEMITDYLRDLVIAQSINLRTHYHTGKCIRRFGGIYEYCRYFIDPKW